LYRKYINQFTPVIVATQDQEDHSSSPAQANSSHDPLSKNLSQKRAGGVAQDVGPDFKFQY
jgi:hypothetical protein